MEQLGKNELVRENHRLRTELVRLKIKMSRAMNRANELEKALQRHNLGYCLPIPKDTNKNGRLIYVWHEKNPEVVRQTMKERLGTSSDRQKLQSTVVKTPQRLIWHETS